MKATVTEDAAGLRYEIMDDGSAEYERAVEFIKRCGKWSEIVQQCEDIAREEGFKVMEAEIAALHAEVERLTAAWIPVSERLPEPWGNVLIAVRGEYVFLGCFTGGGWRGPCDMTQEGVTHWMPLPAPPTE